MDAARTCPECGAELPAETAAGQCPYCLLGLGLVGAEAEPVGQRAEDGGQKSEVRGQTAETDSRPKANDPSFPSGPSPLPSPFGDYELLEEIGHGGMGVVYKARQKSLDRIVALKLLLFGPHASPESVRRFRAEAVATAALQHPNIVAIHEVGLCAGQHFLVMDFVAGPSLAKLIGNQPLPAKRAAGYVKTIAEAIHYAHERGLLHRDLKPSNVLIDANDHPRVTDFGLAKRLEGDSELTVSGQVLGSPNYMPPEQATGKRGTVSRRSDVYALGAILYHALTGRPPFVAEGLADTVQQVLNAEPVSPRVLNPRLPADLETVCLKCLEKEPGRRYATAQLLAQELGRFLEGKPVLARPVGRLAKVGRWCRRRPARASLIAALLVVVALGATGVLWQWRRAERNAQQRTLEYQRAEEAISQLEIRRAEDLFAADSPQVALAYLARVVRLNPSTHVAAERLISALSYRGLALPLAPPLKHEAEQVFGAFSPDGRRVLTAGTDGTVRVWNAETGEPMTPPLRHQGPIRTASFSPDSRRVLTASLDKTARLWDARSGQPVAPPLEHEAAVHSAEFDFDGQLVVTASEDKTARVWDARTGQPLSQPLRHKFGVLYAQFSPDGQRVVTAGGPIWDWRAGRPITDELKHQWVVNHARFSPDGKEVVTASGDLSARVWDAATGQPATGLLQHKQAVLDAEFSPDSQQVLTVSSDKTARIWDAHTGQPLAPPLRHDEGLTAAHFSADGQFVITAADDATARVWDARTGQLLLPPLKHGAPVDSAWFSPDGRRVLTASRDQTARLWEVRLGLPLSVILKHNNVVRFARFSPDGQRVATASWDATGRVWDARTGRPLTPALEHREPLTHIEFSPDGRRLVTSSVDDTARVWDAVSGRPVTPPLEAQTDDVYDVQFSPDGRRVVAAVKNGFALIWDAQTGHRLGPPLRHGSMVASARFSPDGRRVLTASIDGTARIWDAQTAQPLASPLRHDSWVTCARFSPDGRRVVTASRDTTARVWDALTGQPVTGPLKHDNYVVQAEFSPDGRRVVTASADHAARIWDARTGQCLAEPLRHRAQVRCAQFSPDGLRIVTASMDQTARVWDAQTGQVLSEPLCHEADVWSAQFSPDGQWVVTASADHTARIWDVSRAPAPAPAWLPELAEAVAGERLNERRISEPVAAGQFLRLKDQLARSAASDLYTRWARWFLQEPLARTISPFSDFTVSDYAGRRMEENTLESLREAWRLSPTNATVLARLALQTLALNLTNGLGLNGHADWLSRRALELGPDQAEAWWARAQVCQRGSNLVQALNALNRAITLITNSLTPPDNGSVISLSTSSLVHKLPQLKRRDAAAESLADLRQAHRAMCLDRGSLLRELGRLDEAAADHLFARSIHARDTNAGPNQLDLSLHYNGALTEAWQVDQAGNDLAALPRGLVNLGGVRFDVRGVVQLSGGRVLERHPGVFPERVCGIRVGRSFHRLLALQATAGSVGAGTQVAAYVLHYADGTQRELALRYGEETADWSPRTGEPGPLKNAARVWTGTNAVTSRICLYLTAWDNPRPGEFVETLDFVSATSRCAPFVVAITADP